jgi:hypothetical protein
MPSIDDHRRTVLTGVAAALAGCASNGTPPSETQSASPTDLHTTTVTRTASTSATSTGTLTLEPIPAREVDDTLTVYPADLRQWLRTAAMTNRTVRARSRTPTSAPNPPLPAFERVRFDDEAGELSGSYDLSVEGETRYQLLVGADEESPPADAEVTPVSSLAERRREVALAAIPGSHGDDARVYPETELGSWVRHEFFGGYFSHDGTTYRGKEAQQTDAEFFATEVWYVLTAESRDASSAQVTFRLAPIDDGVRRRIEERRTEEYRPYTMEIAVEGETAAAARRFSAANPVILTHDAIYRVTWEA